MKRKIGVRHFAGLAVVVAALVVVPLAIAAAISSTDNVGFVGPSGYVNQACTNGHGTDCNIYLDKRDVWLSGLPVSSALGAGTYFFEINVPGGQPSPNDGGAKNLSDTFADPYAGGTNADGSAIPSGDDWTNREFTVDGSGHITSYLGSHQFDAANDKIQMFPYDDTTNGGGVYILAVCKVPDGVTATGAGMPGVDAKDCKYDAFKVKEAETQCDPNVDPNCGVPFLSDLVVTKDATPAFTRDYDWSVAKTQTTSSTPINGSGSTTNVGYNVKASWTQHDSGWTVSGKITVTNLNDVDFTGVLVTDAVDNGGDCSVTGGVDATIDANSSKDFAYTCSYASAPSPSAGTNTAKAEWDATAFNTPDGSADFNVGFTFDDGSAGNPTVTHDTTTVTDTFAGNPTTLGVAKVDGTFTKDALNNLWAGNVTPTYDSTTHTFTFIYTRAVPVVNNTCVTYDNTATVTDGDQNADNSSSASVTVCGKVTGGLTIGFWSNKNGKAVLCAHDPAWRNLLNGAAASAPYNTGSYLRNANGTKYTVPAGSCATADTSYSNWLLSANAVNMSYMLSAQLSATINNVAFNGMLGGTCIAGTDGSPITINNLIAGAISFLQANGNTTASGAARTLATAYKNIFDGLNNGNVFSVPGCV